jgi:hypothetical protein
MQLTLLLLLIWRPHARPPTVILHFIIVQYCGKANVAAKLKTQVRIHWHNMRSVYFRVVHLSTFSHQSDIHFHQWLPRHTSCQFASVFSWPGQIPSANIEHGRCVNTAFVMMNCFESIATSMYQGVIETTEQDQQLFVIFYIDWLTFKLK